MKRLVLLALAVAILGLALGGLARRGVLPGRERPPAAAVTLPETTITVAWDGATLAPERLRVPRDTWLTLSVRSSAPRFAYLEIPGYGPRGPSVPVVPGSERAIRFVTDRPGDGFALLLDGRPVGRLDVTGEHLEEDRR